MRKLLVVFLFFVVSGLVQVQVDFREGYLDCYMVVRGDILWDILGKFFCQLWKWLEFWYVNLQIQNFYLIYFGDIFSLVYVDGQLWLVLNCGELCGIIKLLLKICSMLIVEVILIILLDKINSFLLVNCIVDDEKIFISVLYIVVGNVEWIVSGIGDCIYVCGKFVDGQLVYGIFCQGKVYIDLKIKEVFGINVDDIGGGEVVVIEGDVVILVLICIIQEVCLGDCLFFIEECVVNFIFMFGELSCEVKGEIIDVLCGVIQIGQFDVVILNCGQCDGLVEGNVLVIYKVGEMVCDCVIGELVKIFDECVGLLMVFCIYKKLSYVLVLMVSRLFLVIDRVQNF